MAERFGKIQSELSIGAGQSVRRNAGDSAFEVFSSPPNLFQSFADSTTPDTATTTLLTATLAAGQLGTNGDTIRVLFAGTFAANANRKLVYPHIFGTDLTQFDANQNGGNFLFEVEIIRVSSSVVRVIYHRTITGVAEFLQYAEITGLTLSNALDLKLIGRTPDNAGDLTLKIARGVFNEAA